MVKVQYEPITNKSQASKYKSISQTIATIYKEEGLFAFWKGHLTGQILSLSFTSIHLIWFEALTRMVHQFNPDLIEDPLKKIFTHSLCGSLSGALTILNNQPVDTIRTRLVTQGKQKVKQNKINAKTFNKIIESLVYSFYLIKVYNGINDAIKKIYRNEGIKGFYRGTVAAIILTVPETGIRFGCYQFLNKNWSLLREYFNVADDRWYALQTSLNGSLSGVAAKTIVYPFDVTKKRLQIQGFEEARQTFGKVVKFTGLFNCIIVTIKEEGVLGLYKGYLPSMLKAAFSSGLIFFTYETLSNIFRRAKLANEEND